MKYLNNLFVISLVLFISSYFLSLIWQMPLFVELLSGAGLVMLVSTLFVLPKKDLLLPILLLAVSMSIILITSSSPLVLWIGLREMSAIVPLIILISLVGWIIGHRPYVKALILLGEKRITTTFRFYFLVSAMTHFIASFMTVGGIPFVYQIFKDSKKPTISEDAWEFALSTAIMRGFTLTVLWTAVHPAFAYVIVGTNAPLLPTAIKGIGLAFIGFFISFFVFRLQAKRLQMPSDITPDLPMNDNQRLNGLISQFVLWVLLIMGGILLTNLWFSIDILLAVPIVIVAVTTLYFLCNHSMTQYKTLLIGLVKHDLGKKKKEIMLILAAGILVGTLKETGYGQVLFSYFLLVIDFMNINILIGLTLIVVLLGFCGFPPIPAMVLLSGILVDIPGSYSLDLIALSLLLGVSVTLIIAPVTVPLLLLSGQNGRSLAENGFHSNLLFGLALLVIGTLYIQLLTLF
ncbi:hypothetical protein [Bacillus suaedae]|uniref:Uncharacterized protein n=1 Tax=Halalkalibacter suaedae TaxID=2822140 RepID=A0A941AQ73_9BACI|nr:hypothetical protein [Bacillus suaedae]MBP3953575.1 hypothetical protein [Bacillus suaedae]